MLDRSVGATDGITLGLLVGETVGLKLGQLEPLGIEDGACDGPRVRVGLTEC